MENEEDIGGSSFDDLAAEADAAAAAAADDSGPSFGDLGGGGDVSQAVSSYDADALDAAGGYSVDLGDLAAQQNPEAAAAYAAASGRSQSSYGQDSAGAISFGAQDYGQQQDFGGRQDISEMISGGIPSSYGGYQAQGFEAPTAQPEWSSSRPDVAAGKDLSYSYDPSVYGQNAEYTEAVNRNTALSNDLMDRDVGQGFYDTYAANANRANYGPIQDALDYEVGQQFMEQQTKNQMRGEQTFAGPLNEAWGDMQLGPQGQPIAGGWGTFLDRPEAYGSANMGPLGSFSRAGSRSADVSAMAAQGINYNDLMDRDQQFGTPQAGSRAGARNDPTQAALAAVGYQPSEFAPTHFGQAWDAVLGGYGALGRGAQQAGAEMGKGNLSGALGSLAGGVGGFLGGGAAATGETLQGLVEGIQRGPGNTGWGVEGLQASQLANAVNLAQSAQRGNTTLADAFGGGLGVIGAFTPEQVKELAQDRVYNELVATMGPIAGARYAASKYIDQPGLAGALGGNIARGLADPSLVVGMGVIPEATRAAQMAAGVRGFDRTAQALGGLARGADVVERAFNLPGEMVARGLGAAGTALGGGLAKESKLSAEGAAMAQAAAAAERAGVGLGQGIEFGDLLNQQQLAQAVASSRAQQRAAAQASQVAPQGPVGLGPVAPAAPAAPAAPGPAGPAVPGVGGVVAATPGSATPGQMGAVGRGALSQAPGQPSWASAPVASAPGQAAAGRGAVQGAAGAVAPGGAGTRAAEAAVSSRAEIQAMQEGLDRLTGQSAARAGELPGGTGRVADVLDGPVGRPGEIDRGALEIGGTGRVSPEAFETRGVTAPGSRAGELGVDLEFGGLTPQEIAAQARANAQVIEQAHLSGGLTAVEREGLERSNLQAADRAFAVAAREERAAAEAARGAQSSGVTLTPEGKAALVGGVEPRDQPLSGLSLTEQGRQAIGRAEPSVPQVGDRPAAKFDYAGPGISGKVSFGEGRDLPPMGGGAAQSVKEFFEGDPNWANLGEKMQQKAIGLAESRYAQEAYANVQRDSRLAQQLEQANRPAAAARVAAKYGKTSMSEVDPVAVAVGAHLQDYSKTVLGFDPSPRNPGFYSELALQMTGAWKGAVLSGPSWHAGNVLDITGKSLQQGFAPFTGSFGAKLAKLGLAEVAAGLERTGGAPGRLANEMGNRVTSQVGVQGAKQLFGDAARAVAGGNPLTAPGRAVVEFNRAIGGIIESNARAAILAQATERHMMTQGIPSVVQSIRQALLESGVNRADAARTAYGVVNLEKWTPNAIGDYAAREGLRAEQVQAVRQLAANALEKAQAKGLAAVDRIHFNYADRTNLELNPFVQVALPFTTWATRNVKYYAEATLNRPGLWSAISAYGKQIERNNELEMGASGRLGQNARVTGALGELIGSLAYGDPKTRVYSNAFDRMVANREQNRAAITGPGANPLAAGVMGAIGTLGIGVNPAISLPMQMMGLMGDVQPQAPLSGRNAFGAAIQGFYGQMNPGRSYEMDFSRMARTVGLGQPSLESKRPSVTGLGRDFDRQVNERVALDATRAGLSTNRNGQVLGAYNNPRDPSWAAALQALTDQRTNIPQQWTQAALGLRGMPQEKFDARVAQAKNRELEAQGYPYATGLALNPQAATFNLASAPFERTQVQAELANRGLGVTRSPYDREQYPGLTAPPAVLNDYYDREYGRNLQQAQWERSGIERFDQSRAQLADINSRWDAVARDLQERGFSPMSTQWAEAKRAFNQEIGQFYDSVRDQRAQGLPSAFDVTRPFSEQTRIDREERMNPYEVASQLRGGYYNAVQQNIYGQGLDRTLASQAFRDAERNNGRIPAENMIPDIMSARPGVWTEEQLKAALGGAQLPGFAEWNARNQGLQEQTRQGVLDAFFSGRDLSQQAAQIAYNNDLRANRDIAAVINNTYTLEQLQSAAAKLGITVAPNTVAPSRAQQERDRWEAGSAPLPATQSLMAPPTAPQLGLPTQTQTLNGPQLAGAPLTSAGRIAQGLSAPATSRSSSRGTSTVGGTARGGGLSNEPFSGNTANQQWGSAWGYVGSIRDSQGPLGGNAQAAKFVYDNYDKFEALAAAVGKPLGSRGEYGKAALGDVETRPGAFEGMTLQEGMNRVGEMISTLQAATRDPNLNTAAFADKWAEKFGEKLDPKDLTREALTDKLNWAQANYAQGKKYMENNPEGVKEKMQAEQEREQRSQAIQSAVSRQEQARSAVSSAYQEYEQSKAQLTAISGGQRLTSANRDQYNAAKAEQTKIVDKLNQAKADLEAAREEVSKAYEDAKSKSKKR